MMTRGLRRPIRPRSVWVLCVLLLPLAVDHALAQSTGQQQVNGIYTCTDANGRKWRSDRPIPQCMDREQTVLNPSGTVKARVGPNLTALERAEAEAKRKVEEEARAQALEDKRRERALLIRYPSREVHDQERAKALAQVEEVVDATRKRIDALQLERKKNTAELEFYKGDVNKAPAALRHQIEHVRQSLELQNRFIQAQQGEQLRINARFDEELLRLRELWRAQDPSTVSRP
ncbi:MAG: DUF4124 domain-containing protein [Betaproteobacteria bacterium]